MGGDEGRTFLFAIASLLAFGCGRAATDSAAGVASSAAQPPPHPATTRDAVANATIGGVFDAPVTLKDGKYEGRPYVAGGAAYPRLLLLADRVLFADLDGSPAKEAVSLLAESSGGSGERIYLSVIGLRDGQARSLGTVLVGDRTRIRDVAVDGRTIVLDVIEIGPNEAACCPTQQARKTYSFEGDRVTLTRSEVTGKVPTPPPDQR